MPAKFKSITVESEKADSSLCQEQFLKLRHTVPTTYEDLEDLIKETREHLIKTSDYSFAVEQKLVSEFEHLYETFPFSSCFRMQQVQIQRVSYQTNSQTYYQQVAEREMCLLLVLKKERRGYNSIDIISEGKRLPITIASCGLYILPHTMSEMIISSSNAMDGNRPGGRNVARAIMVKITVEAINDNPRMWVTNRCIDKNMSDAKKARKLDEAQETLTKKFGSEEAAKEALLEMKEKLCSKTTNDID
jgi:hypothetical protein